MTIASPGYVPDVHSTDPLDPAWGDAIRDRAWQVFADAAARDAAITAPVIGEMAVLISPATGTLTGIYEYVGPVQGWAQPWNMPWGAVALGIDTNNQSDPDASEHVLGGGWEPTFNAVAGRIYRISVAGAWRNLHASAAGITIKVKDSTVLIDTPRLVAMAGGGIDTPVAFSVETTLSAASHTINVTHQSANSDGVECIGGNFSLIVNVDDVGPATAPS